MRRGLELLASPLSKYVATLLVREQQQNDPLMESSAKHSNEEKKKKLKEQQEEALDEDIVEDPVLSSDGSHETKMPKKRIWLGNSRTSMNQLKICQIRIKRLLRRQRRGAN
ncbi:hypothetical protein Ancab_037871 [Ancistrocladus abbreviatus]